MSTGATILVVEDDHGIQKLVEKLLSAEGFKVVCCGNGEDALVKLQRLRPALILTDVVMPVMTGLQLVQELKGNVATEEIPVIMMTTRDKDTEVFEGYAHGADYYMTKPFTAKQLLHSIRKFV